MKNHKPLIFFIGSVVLISYSLGTSFWLVLGLSTIVLIISGKFSYVFK